MSKRRNTRTKQLTHKAIALRRVERARTCPVCAYPITVISKGGPRGFYRVFDDGCKRCIDYKKAVCPSETDAVVGFVERMRTEHLIATHDTKSRSRGEK